LRGGWFAAREVDIIIDYFGEIFFASNLEGYFAIEKLVC